MVRAVTTVKGIPAIPSVIVKDANLQVMLDTLKESVEVLTGTRGDPNSRALTYGEASEGGLTDLFITNRVVDAAIESQESVTLIGDVTGSGAFQPNGTVAVPTIINLPNITLVSGGNAASTYPGEPNGPYGVLAGGGGNNIEVQDEGTPLTTAVTKFNFAGAGVTVTEPVTDEMLVTIPLTPPGGSDTYIQYNDGGAFGGIATITYNDGTGLLDFDGTDASKVIFRKGFTMGTNQPIRFGDSSTTLFGASTDTISMTTGNVRRFYLTGSLLQVEQVGLSIQSTEIFYLDGGGNTNISEPSADLMRFRAGNVIALDLAAATATFGVPVLLPAATTSIPSLRLPHGTAPSSPTNGDMWTTTAGLYVRINGSTIGPLS